MPHTSISKLIYAAPTPKNTPTKVRVKSIHQIVNKKPSKINQNKDKASHYVDVNDAFYLKTMSNSELLKKKLEGEKDNDGMNIILKKINATNEFQTHTTDQNLDIKKSEIQYLPEANSNIEKSTKETMCDLELVSTLLNTNNTNIKQVTDKNDDIKNSLTNKTSSNNLEISPLKNLSTLNSNKSTSTLKDNLTVDRKKSFKLDEIKNFMKTQREKWKAEENEEKMKGKPNKIEIKKRLQELHKSSLKILQSNLRKSRKSKTLTAQIPEKEEKFNRNTNFRRSNLSSAKSIQDKETKILKEKSNINPISSSKLPLGNEIIESDSKVGILRKNGNDENSFSIIKDYDVNKENAILESLVAPKSSLTTKGNISANNQTLILKPDFECITKEKSRNIAEPQIQNTEEDISANSKNKNTRNKVTDNEVNLNISLQVPKAKMESKVLEKSEKYVQTQIPHNNYIEPKLDDLPYWLKPSKVEIYPYNFITAVRKKLEALTRPVAQPSQIPQRKRKNSLNIPSSVYQETPVSHGKVENEKVRRRIIEKDHTNMSSSNQNYSKSEYRNGSPVFAKNLNTEIAIANSFSEPQIMSTHSSISLHFPESNAVSDMSSFKSDVKLSKGSKNEFLSSTKNHIQINDFEENDDTTISSSVFSSPEKKNYFMYKENDSAINEKISENNKSLSPLSLENITNLQIKSKSQNSSNKNLRIPKLNFKFNSNEETEQDGSDKNSISKSKKFSELDQLLADFNKSLSHVIEVNNKLKTNLDKPQQYSSPNKKTELNFHKHQDTPIIPRQDSSNFNTFREYTSDFEEEEPSNTTLIPVEDNKLSVNTISNNDIRLPSINLGKPIISSDQDQFSDQNMKHNNEKPYLNGVHTNSESNSKLSLQISSKTDLPQSTDKSITTQITEELADSTIEENIQNFVGPSENNSMNETAINLNHPKENKIENELHEKIKYINNHVNTSRGNVNKERCVTSNNQKDSAFTEKSSVHPFNFNGEKIDKQNENINSSIGSEFIAVYNKSDIEISMFLQEDNQSMSSEKTLNYSSIGLYEQLLQSENLKSKQLTALLKIREKVLIDRTKGQIAWLEIQKEKYKSKGLIEHITAIKKKQRAILMKMQKEREDIKKLINSQIPSSGTQTTRIKNQHQTTLMKTYRPTLSENISNITIRKEVSTTINKSQSSTKIIRGIDIGSSKNLEKILTKREEQLKNRREHVERLMAWHQRLDKEEEEILQLEKDLLQCNKNNWQISSPTPTQSIPCILSEDDLRKEKKIAEIEKSLKSLQKIPIYRNENSDDIIDNVRIYGHKLNKLWFRLTGKKVDRFDPHKKYKLTKSDLEKFYEKAKEEVVEEFQKEKLFKIFDQSQESFCNTGNSSTERNNNNSMVHSIDVPSLHLNFSSESEIAPLESPTNQKLNTENINAIEINKSTLDSIEIIDQPSHLNTTQKLLKKEILIPEQHKATYDRNERSENISNSTNGSSEDSTSILNYSISKKRQTDVVNQDSIKYVINSCSPLNDKTFNLNKFSSELPQFLEENSSKEESVETNEISEHIISTTCSTENINLELTRPSVIVSTKSNSGINLSKDLQVKSTPANLDMKTSISSGTKAYSTEKHTPTIKSVSPHHIKYKTNLPEQLSESNDSSTKTPSLISSENLQISSIKNMNTSIFTDTILSLANDELVEFNRPMPASELFSIPNPENNLEETSEQSYEYENDFSGSELTNIEDISMPKFETTMETTKITVTNNNLESSSLNITENLNETTELEKRLIVLDDSLKDLNDTFQKVLSPEKENLINSKNTTSLTSTSPILSSVSVTIATATVASIKTSPLLPTTVQQQNSPISTTILHNTNEYDKITLMPDIISEVEIRRRQQMLIENDIKQLGNAIPCVVFREIPNKPPPPYVPPAHGSPMTTIFPSEARIKEITFRRTAELFEEFSKNSEKSVNIVENSILNEQITNIYERIILDICKECVEEYKDTLRDLNPETYKNRLALYNPPNKLKCMQEFNYGRVRKLLSMERTINRNNSIFSIGRKKRDHVDEILLQELHEEEYKWTNFDQEEDEVKISIIEEILDSVIKDVIIESTNRDRNIIKDIINKNM